MTIDAVDRPPTQCGQNVFIEDSQDLRARTLAASLQAQPAELHPLIEHGLEGMLRRKNEQHEVVASALIGIDTLSDQSSRLITTNTGFFEAYLRIGTQRHALLHARPVVFETPDFPATGGHAERKPIRVAYLFRHHDGNYQPRVAGNIPTANYIAKARAARDALNDREALAASRQALEMLSEKTWRWLGSHDQGLLNLLLAGVGAEPGLRNLCEALVKKLRDAQTFNHANKDPLLTAYGQILGIPVTNLVWTYLNKGTHEEAERDDF